MYICVHVYMCTCIYVYMYICTCNKKTVYFNLYIYLFIYLPVFLLIRKSKLREQAVEVLRDLLSAHDSDVRYSSVVARARIASIYLPLLSVVMDNFHRLYKVHTHIHTHTDSHTHIHILHKYIILM